MLMKSRPRDELFILASIAALVKSSLRSIDSCVRFLTSYYKENIKAHINILVSFVNCLFFLPKKNYLRSISITIKLNTQLVELVSKLIQKQNCKNEIFLLIIELLCGKNN
jgi:hypothetical protein